MKLTKVILGTLGVLVLAAATNPALAETPSLGKIVWDKYKIVLPASAWQYGETSSAGSGNPSRWVDDKTGAAYTAATTTNLGTATELSTSANNGAQLGGLFPIPPSAGQTQGVAVKMEFAAAYGFGDGLYWYTPDTTTAGFPVLTDGKIFSASDTEGKTVTFTATNPFGFYVKNGTAPDDQSNFPYFTQDAKNTDGTGTDSAGNTYVKHFKMFEGTDGYYYFGLEDKIKGKSDRDFNDYVFRAQFAPVPEPAFYQLAAFLSGGGLLALRLRRKRNS